MGAAMLRGPMALFLTAAVICLAAGSPGLAQSMEGAADPKAMLSELSGSIEETIAVETDSLTRYRRQLKTLQNLRISLAAAANAYQVQLSTYGNLVLSADPALGNLEKAWTDIDSMLNVETAIRFEIDRLFSERGIEISFPQRDVHVRSWIPEARVALEKGAAEEEKGEEK